MEYTKLKFYNDFRSCNIYPSDGYLIEMDNDPLNTTGVYISKCGREGVVLPLIKYGDKYKPDGQPIYWTALRLGGYNWSPVDASEF